MIRISHVINTLPKDFRVSDTRRDRLRCNIIAETLLLNRNYIVPPTQVEDTPTAVSGRSNSNMPPRKSIDLSKAGTADEGTPAKEAPVREGVNIEVRDFRLFFAPSDTSSCYPKTQGLMTIGKDHANSIDRI